MDVGWFGLVGLVCFVIFGFVIWVPWFACFDLLIYLVACWILLELYG